MLLLLDQKNSDVSSSVIMPLNVRKYFRGKRLSGREGRAYDFPVAVERPPRSSAPVGVDGTVPSLPESWATHARTVRGKALGNVYTKEINGETRALRTSSFHILINTNWVPKGKSGPALKARQKALHHAVYDVFHAPDYLKSLIVFDKEAMLAGATGAPKVNRYISGQKKPKKGRGVLLAGVDVLGEDLRRYYTDTYDTHIKSIEVVHGVTDYGPHSLALHSHLTLTVLHFSNIWLNKYAIGDAVANHVEMASITKEMNERRAARDTPMGVGWRPFVSLKLTMMKGITPQAFWTNYISENLLLSAGV